MPYLRDKGKGRNKFYLSRLYKSKKDLNYKGESVIRSLDRINAVYLKTRDKSLKDLKEAKRPDCYILRSARALKYDKKG